MTKMCVRPITRDSLSEGVVQQIKEMIMDGQLKPGQWLPPQTKLAAGFNVGLATVRQAVRGLALVGILETLPGRGTRVSDDADVALRMLRLLRLKPEETRVEQVYEARRMLELVLTELAAENASEKDLEQIEASLNLMESAIHNGGSFVDADMAFHRAVANASGNTVMTDVYRFFHVMLDQVTRKVVDTPKAMEDGLEKQRAILQCIRKGDVEDARRKAGENIGQWWQTYCRQSNPAPSPKTAHLSTRKE